MRIRNSFILGGGLLMVVSAGGAVAAQSGQDSQRKDTAPAIVRLEESPAGQVPVGDREGVVRGTVDVEAMDRVSGIAGRFLAENDGVLAPDGGSPTAPDGDAMALSDAVMALEAIPVYGPDGEIVVGRFGARFIEEGAYEAARVEAQEVVVEATGKAYPSR